METRTLHLRVTHNGTTTVTLSNVVGLEHGFHVFEARAALGTEVLPVASIITMQAGAARLVADLARRRDMYADAEATDERFLGNFTRQFLWFDSGELVLILEEGLLF